MKKRNIKSIVLTIFLIIIVIYLVYVLIGINITGPYHKTQDKIDKVITKIEEKEKNVQSITRHSFKYVTYTCESEDYYRIYDENGRRILSRKKAELNFDKVRDIIYKSYPELKDIDIQVSYGYKNGVFLVEDDNYTMLMLDIDTHKKVFYMKEGSE